MRRRLQPSQAELATRFVFTTARIHDWEQGHSQPHDAVRIYLMVIDRDPRAVERALKAG